MTTPTNGGWNRDPSPPPHEPPPHEPPPAPTSSSGWGTPPPSSQAPPPQDQPPQWAPPTAGPTQQFGAPQPGQWDQSAQQYPPTGEQPFAQSGAQWSPQQQPDQSGSQWATEQLPTQQPYAGGSGSQWAGQPSGPTYGGPPPAKSNKKLYAIIAAVVALALVGGGLFFFLSGDDITYQGRDIVEPEQVLTDAESTLDGIVEQRNGATNEETSCYFVVKNADTTDVEDLLVCGPVLFVDGDEGQPYLTFPLQGSAGDGDARLTVAAEPVSPEPAELANPDLLRRPDGGTPPEGSGGLAAPDPPPAEEGLFTVIPSEGVELDAPPNNARIGSPTLSIDLTGIGEPERYGQGDDARRPAEGEKFVAFELTGGPGENGPIGEFSISVLVGDDEPLPLPDDAVLEGESETLVLSVPDGAEDVDLVVSESDLVQRLSLTTGDPDPGNIALWQRTNRLQTLAFSQALTIRASQPGFVTDDLQSTVTVDQVVLDYFPSVGRSPSAPTNAFLVLDAELILDGQGGLLFEPPFWSLTLADGTVLPAVNLATEPGQLLIAFEVLASFTEGTVALGGVATTPGGLTLDTLGVFLSIPVSIPAG